MMIMPLMGWLTDRYGPRLLPVCGIPLAIVGVLPFVLITADTPYALLCAGSFLQGLGVGIAVSPTVTLALNAVPPPAISRTSTAVNIIDQAAASIGTALVSVVLVAAVGQMGLHSAGTGGGLDVLHELLPAQREAVAGPLSDAFAATFLWPFVLMILSLLPALAMALGGGSKREAQFAGESPTAMTELCG
jgi:MFS family permease